MTAPAIRDHNSFYLTEAPRHKKYFDFVWDHARRDCRPGAQVIDIGCATGDFLSFLAQHELDLTGADVDAQFLAKAANFAATMELDIYSKSMPTVPRFDVAFMLGVNYLFSEPGRWIQNLMRVAEVSYVFGVFNPEPLDVRMLVSRPDDPQQLQPWNLISQETIRLACRHYGVACQFIPWTDPPAIERTAADPMRSWSIPAADGSLIIVNGMQIVHTFALLRLAHL